MAFGHLLKNFMAVLIFNTAFMCNAENTVSVQTGSSIQLDIQANVPPDFFSLVWMNEKSENIVTFVDKEAVNQRNNVVFNQTTFSLTLKNMQKTDSGLYIAKIYGATNEDAAEYRISVIDPVDSPVLNWNITMISVNSCIVNVTCSGHDHTISNSYHSNNCSQEEVTSFEMQALTMYCKEDIVICNYSNPVSWKNDTIQIKQLCTPYENKSIEENNSSFPLLWLMVIVISASLMILVATGVLYCFCKNHNKGAQEENDQTIYAQVQPEMEVQRPLEMLEKSANPQTVYGFTGEHKQTHNTSQPSPEIPAQMQTNNPVCTTYSTIGQHQKPSFATETDHTVYSKVYKSPHGRPHVH